MEATDAAPFERWRGELVELAYRMTGRLSVAEDLVQETYLRWQDADQQTVENPKAYLTTIATRLALDELKSARARREEYTGPWLPEPRVEDATPEEQAATNDALSMGMLRLLETLTPIQRAVFVLREGFGYDYGSIGEVVGKTRAHCRKIAQRARDRIQEKRPRYEVETGENEQLVERFLEAAERGNPEALAEMLAEDAVLYSDGGDIPYAAKRPIYGADRIQRFLVSIAAKKTEDFRVQGASVGGGPGFLIYEGDRLQSAWALEVADGQIQRVYVVLNPEKLQHVTSKR